MFTMAIFGVSVVFLLGIINLLLLLFQFLSGMHFIKVKYKMHKRAGIVFLATGLLHAILAILANM
jgi:hypothetical protein